MPPYEGYTLQWSNVLLKRCELIPSLTGDQESAFSEHRKARQAWARPSRLVSSRQVDAGLGRSGQVRAGRRRSGRIPTGLVRSIQVQVGLGRPKQS